MFDAWEIGNGRDLFDVIGLRGYKFIANSDLHHPEQIYSWKTLVQSRKSSASVKEAIKRGNIALLPL